MNARIGLFGSNRVKELLVEFLGTRNRFYNEAQMLTRMLKDPGSPQGYGKSLPEQRRAIDHIRSEFRDQGAEITDQMARELQAPG